MHVNKSSLKSALARLGEVKMIAENMSGSQRVAVSAASHVSSTDSQIIMRSQKTKKFGGFWGFFQKEVKGLGYSIVVKEDGTRHTKMEDMPNDAVIAAINRAKQIARKRVFESFIVDYGSFRERKQSRQPLNVKG